MARHLAQRGLRMQDVAAAITVSTTLQTFAQILFALIGVVLLGTHTSLISEHALRTSALVASGLLALQVGGFYLLQRRGLFGKLMRAATRISGKRDWCQLMSQAEAMDLAVQLTYTRSGSVAAGFVLSWSVGSSARTRCI